MTQTKTGAFPSMGRIPQIFGHTVLAASMLAGGASLLNAGGAMAAFPCGNLGTVGTPGFTYTQVADTGPTIPATSALSSCTISSPVGGSPDFVTMDVKFVPELVGAQGPGTYSYYLTSDNGRPFIAGLIDSDLDLGTGTVRKEVFAVDGEGNPILGQSIFDRTSTDGSSSGLIGFSDITQTTIYVRDTYNIDNLSQLDNFTNTFQTPGPLPILGAGAAFGFSRKLRGRIKAARLG